MLLYLLVTARSMISRFSRPYSSVRPAKNLKLFLLKKMFRDLTQRAFITSKSLKLFLT